MKKIILMMLYAAFCLSMSAQERGSEPHRVYCELVGYEKFLSKKCKVEVDFGQNPYEDKRIAGEDGKSLTFNSMVDAMNYMGRFGWEFKQAYVVSISGQNIYHWLLSKKVDDDSEIREGITTKEDLKE